MFPGFLHKQSENAARPRAPAVRKPLSAPVGSPPSLQRPREGTAMEMKPFLQSLQTHFPATPGIRRSFLILLLPCAFSFLMLAHIMGRYAFSSSETIDSHTLAGLILDTPGCRIAKLDPFDESVKDLIDLKEPYVCGGSPVFVTTERNATIVLNETVLYAFYNVSLKNVSCSYNAIYRQKEPNGYWGENTISMGETKVLEFGAPLGEEFLKIQCLVGERPFTQYVPLVPVKPWLKKVESSQPDALNVILIGIDSVSKLNFLRHFKRTHAFLTAHLSAFDMRGYTKVGDNTFPNLVPLLTGHFIEHYWNESISKEMFFDDLDFIWKAYSKEGYRTFYAEDSPYTGTFNYLKRGFENPPTDYYFRPLALAMEDSELKKNSSAYCLNSQLETEIIYGYLKDFLRTMDGKPSFSFTMVSTLTHNDLNEAGYADEPTYKLLKDLWKDGMMNRSLLVIFSDHGIRFGAIRETYIGKFEERMPFMYITLPTWFLDRHRDLARQLQTNQNRLITLFDVHATLCHLLGVSNSRSQEAKADVNGISLMHEISEYRTCEMAHILPHWCPCQVYSYVPPNDENVAKAAAAIINDINRKLEPFKERCARLEVANVTDARIGQASELMLRFVKHQNDVLNRYVEYGEKGNALSDFLVTLRATPGGGMFEGSVRLNRKEASLKVLGISRINKYGKQSWCINSQDLKRFCYCKYT